MNFFRLHQSQTQRPSFPTAVRTWLVLVCALTGLTAGRTLAAPAPGTPRLAPAAAGTTPGSQFNTLPASQRSALHLKTDEAFWQKHPELNRSKLKADSDPRLIQEYMALRREITEGTLQRAEPALGSATASRASGSVNPMELGARAQAMMGEMGRLVSEYENASPARRDQLRARIQALSDEAIKLREQALALARSELAAGRPAPPPIAGGAAGLPSLEGTVGANGKLTPATSLAMSPEKYLASLADDREKKARVRAEQERIFLEDARMQAIYRDQGVSDFNKAAGRAGLDVFNGGARVGMAAFAPEWVYQGYEGLNSGAESINAAKEAKPWDTAKGAQSAVKGFKDSGDALAEGLISLEPSAPTRFDKFGRAMEVVDFGVNAKDFAKATSESNRLEQGKEGLAMAGNVATLAAEVDRFKRGAGVASRIGSGANGALAVGEGVYNINQTLDEKSDFAQSANARIQDANVRARAAAERARLNQELARFLRDLEARTRQEEQLVVPPSQNQNQDHFRTHY